MPGSATRCQEVEQMPEAVVGCDAGRSPCCVGRSDS